MPEAAGTASANAVEPPDARARPLLVYDGDCGFCTYWARYWQQLTGDRVDYQPYQQVAARYPAIAEADFQRAVQYIAPDGRRASAAEASFRTLSHAPGRAFWLALYRQVPGFAFCAERVYAFIAAHRAAGYRLSLLLWGRELAPPRYGLIAYMFVRLLGLIYLSAFVSFGVQAQGLIGSHGILPLSPLLQAIASRVGAERFYLMPTLFWCDASDRAIATVCWTGAALSLLLVLNVLPRLNMLLLYVLYLSLLYGGQTFMNYQWDVFLLEAGFLALLLSCTVTPAIWLLRWLLFRFMFMSGVVKLLSGDPNWRHLTALSYHFLTQPLPTPLAWYAAQLPAVLLQVLTGGLFVVELLLPPLIFCPRRLRFVAAGGILLLQLCIVLTGNYNWFNLQTMLLCLLLGDDAALRRLLPQRLVRWLLARLPVPPLHPPRRPFAAALVGALALLLVFCSLVQMDLRFGGSPPAAAQAVERSIEPFQMVSGYGLFAVMTTTRHEIVVEGSMDGVVWREYGFRYKPGELSRRPPWNVPHQPRLDWQLWFAALEDPRDLDWFEGFLRRLLENEPAVTALLAHNPFPTQPPRFVRAQLYDYTFADAAQRSQGLWWNRRLLGQYFPAARLKGD